MSDSSKFVAESLEELLVGIADGVREAQSALNEAPPFDQFGRPMPTYQLPYVDFDVKVELESSETSTGHRKIHFLPISGSTNKNINKDISSSISGRFVAIPPGEGLPVPILQMTSTRLGARKHKLELLAANTAGEILQLVDLELNLNLELSQSLSSVQGVSLPSLRGSKLERAVATTNEAGIATTELSIDPGIPKGASIVVTAELDQRQVSIVVVAGSDS